MMTEAGCSLPFSRLAAAFCYGPSRSPPPNTPSIFRNEPKSLVMSVRGIIFDLLEERWRIGSRGRRIHRCACRTAFRRDRRLPTSVFGPVLLSALGRRVSDEFTVPLCRIHHRELHRQGDEAAWWSKVAIDPDGPNDGLHR